MKRIATKTEKRGAQFLACAAILLVTMGCASDGVQTMAEAAAAYERGDYATAFAGFRNYAEQGDPRAQYILGFMYANGEGIPKDAAAAAPWYRLAAEQGNAEAQGILGLMYDRGEGVPRE